MRKMKWKGHKRASVGKKSLGKRLTMRPCQLGATSESHEKDRMDGRSMFRGSTPIGRRCLTAKRDRKQTGESKRHPSDLTLIAAWEEKKSISAKRKRASHSAKQGVASQTRAQLTIRKRTSGKHGARSGAVDKERLESASS